MPADVAARLPRVLPLAEQAVVPADAKAFAQAVDRLLNWVEMFGLVALPTDPDRRRSQLRVIVSSYRTALADLPADLLATAVDRIMAQHSYRNLPLPADIRATVEAELRDRKYLVDRLRTVELMAKRQTAAAEGGFKYRASAEEKAAVERMLERARLRRLPIPEDEDIEPFVDLKTAHEKLAQVRPIRRNPAQASATPVNPTAETADAPADENH